MKIAAISDLHGYLPPVEEMPEAEVLCITGDLCCTSFDRNVTKSMAWFLRDFCKWIEALPYEKVFLVFGNHDFFTKGFLYKDNGSIRRPRAMKDDLFLPKKLSILFDTECVYKKKKFYGSPWCPNLPNWMFYKDHAELVEAFSKIPEDTDVLLTHCAPDIDDYGTSHFDHGYIQDFGCIELASAIYEKRPKLCVFGHIHSGNHVESTWLAMADKPVRLCNVSIMDERYEPTYRIKTFEI